MKRLILFLLVLVMLSTFVNSHEKDSSEVDINKGEDSSSTLKDYTSPIIFISILFITIFTIIALFTQNHQNHKLGLLLGIVIPIVIASVFVVYTTVYTNAISETKGPVHWHADFEIYNCGEFVDLIKPKGLSNRIGTPLFHEHNDNRIHVEGVVVNKKDVDMHSFFEVIGGELTNEKFGAPTDNGYVEINNGDLCNNVQVKWQAFLFKVTNPEAEKGDWIYTQQKLYNFEDYVLSPYSYIPPGDCLILEFGDEKEKTEHLCETYEIAIRKNEFKSGVVQ